jgi:hypothetical protein
VEQALIRSAYIKINQWVICENRDWNELSKEALEINSRRPYFPAETGRHETVFFFSINLTEYLHSDYHSGVLDISLSKG